MASKAPGPITAENDAFRGWDQPLGMGGYVVVEEDPSTHTQEAIQHQQAWLVSPADWRRFDAERLEGEIARLTNLRREEAGARPLAYSARVAGVARGHSLDLTLVGMLSHETPGRPDLSFDGRLKLAGVDFKVAAENIGHQPLVRRIWDDGRQELYTWGEVAHRLVASWMESPPHRANLLSTEVREFGVGAALAAESEVSQVYVTQDLFRGR